MKHHKSRKEKAAALLELLQQAAQQGNLPSEVVRVARLMIDQKQGHRVVQASLTGLVLLLGAAWLAVLLLLPVCWLGLGGPSGCSVSGMDAFEVGCSVHNCGVCVF
jgi:hypothetical protein